MSAELIGIISVGVALGAMILTSVGLTFAAWRWLADSVDKRFNVSEARIDNRFDEVDKRFDKMDKRFDEADKRFEGIEGRLSALEQRVARLEGVLDGLREALFERAAR
jgi:hypothetical protein